MAYRRGSLAAVVAWSLAGCLLAATVGCGGEGGSVPQTASAAPRPPASSHSGIAVDTATVDVPLSLRSQLYVEHDAIIAARAAGPIVSVLADLGTRVRAGQLLARVESTSQELALARAREALQNSERMVRRTRAMAGFGGTTVADSEQVESQHAQAELALRQAERDVELTRVVAPFAGVVTSRYARPQRLVAVGDTLFGLTESAPLLARVRIPEASAGAIHIGSAARVSGVGVANAAASVIRLAPAVDPGSGTREAIVRLAPGVKLLPGSSVIVQLGAERRRAVVVPRGAITPDGFALVLEGDRATLRSVTLGADLGDGRVEVVSGLAPGERIAPPDR